MEKKIILGFGVIIVLLTGILVVTMVSYTAGVKNAKRMMAPRYVEKPLKVQKSQNNDTTIDSGALKSSVTIEPSNDVQTSLTIE